MSARIALDPRAEMDTLWEIAENYPKLRHWLIANPAASPELLEYVAQRGGDGVREGFAALFDDDAGAGATVAPGDGG
ncbi:MAG: hypothetical protein LKI93_05170 [Bifidobacteriaceae bacterium]|jgi:hypothetical protein|nr:hypothetical protein [Bifidobacteriaceae bacterium]MCI1914372.1 hypothetical protein [Bifidobacteriaceae bacterium]